MKVAIITRRLDRLAGVERHAFNLALELEKRGHAVTMYTFHYDAQKTFLEGNGVRVVSLDARRPPAGVFSKIPLIRALVHYQEGLRDARALAALIHADTDVLNPHDQSAYRVAAYYKKVIRDIPSVWSMHDMPTRSFARMRDRECGALARNIVLQIVDTVIDYIEYVRFIKPQDVITVLDERDREWVKEYFKKEAVVTRSGVDPSQFEFMQRSHTHTPVRLLMIGVFFPHRRFEDAVAAISVLKERNIHATLTIIGSHSHKDPYFRNIERIIREKHLEGFVELKGRVTEAELKSAFADADIFLFPNHLQSWGIAVFEALASGIPVIVSKTAGASEVLKDRYSALIIPPKDPHALADAVETLAHDPKLYESLSVNGRRVAESEVSWKRLGDIMERVLKSVLQKA